MCALASLGLRRSAGGFCVAGAALGALRGVGCTPWRPLVSAALPVAFAWQVRRLVLCKRSGGRPGVPSSPPLCRWLFRGSALPRDRMYALASLGLRSFATMVHCKGSDVRPGVPWSPPLCRWLCVAGAALGALQGVGCMPWRPLVSAALPVAFAWQVRHLVLCRGRMYALASLGLRRSAGGFCVAGAALGAAARGRMYALASLGLPFAWQAWDLMCQGVGCTPVPWSPLLRGRCGTWCSASDSDVHPGVPWSPPVCRWLLRGRCGTWCSASGRMYALASLSLRRSGRWLLCGKVRHLVLCKGSDVRPGVPWSPLWLAFAWQVRHWWPRGWMYALALLGLLALCRWLLRGRRGTMVHRQGVGCTPWRPSISGAPPVAFAWQAWDNGAPPRGRMYALASPWCSAGGVCVAGVGLNVHCQGIGCTPWRPLVSAWLLRGRRGTMVHCQGVGCTPWRPLVSAALPVAFAWQAWDNGAPPRGRMYALASLGLRCSAVAFAWQAWDNGAPPRGRMYALASLGLRRLQWLLRGRRGTYVHRQGVGCTPWRPLVSAWRLRGRRGTMVHRQGVGCTPWRPLVSGAFLADACVLPLLPFDVVLLQLGK